ncbi:Similar to hypothetical protein NECHADRAFT_87151 [Nectria haematococca mpVI 77-13-4]; acc. no. XP_003041979 [Pyronema omphalodes CBS 100304]|uniref:F-box domain-containing protein n=1 Tax=Pyronema omphalodes (strain CBS 100304) TaxID=1076935 RepID=U4LRZ8_PYROM|nr:Similar to hypothetical protein NECHADRAFT_87151 [Nectria haematococca mpVI 77-13-4]; acc. no. XP_003041979 [Pyronema omphalodes CBS 100304]
MMARTRHKNDFCHICNGLTNPEDFHSVDPSLFVSSDSEEPRLKPETQWLNEVMVVGTVTDPIRHEFNIGYRHERADPSSFAWIIPDKREGAEYTFITEDRIPNLHPFMNHHYWHDHVFIHKNCYKLFQRAIDVVRKRDFLRELKRTDLRQDVIGHMFNDRLCRLGDNRWLDRGTPDDWHNIEFLDCPEIFKYILKETPKAVPPTKETSIVLDKPDNSRLAVLPPELLLMTMNYLSLKDVQKFRLAYKTAAALPLTQEFWRTRVCMEAPWFWELQDRKLDGVKVDWKQVYLELVVKEGIPYESDGLENRVRVWEVVQRLASECWEAELNEEKGEECVAKELQEFIQFCDNSEESDYL